MATGLTSATISVSANTRQMEKDIAKALKTIELSQIDTKKSSQALGRITGQVSEFNKSLEASNARVIAFGASAGAIFAVEKALSSLVSSTIEVEKKLQDINVLLNLSSSNLEKFGGSLFDVAKNTAQSFSSVAEAATELARQGLGVEETLKRTNAALILARLSGLDTVKSVEALTATLNSFSGSALDAVGVVNKLANVDAAFAVSSADLANAISRVGSTAQDAGVSLDELISIVTAAQQTTARGGAVIGNSLKTIFTRLQRGKVQDLLGSLGVDTSEGQNAISLLRQLATTYDTLGASQKSYIAEQVGGVFQINILKAALADLGKKYSIYDKALATSLSSTDQAIKRNEQLNQTLSALSSQAVSNLEQAASKIGSIVFEPNAKNFLSSFNGIIESFNNIDSETQGGKFIEGFFKGISNFIGGPGTVLAVAVLTKLFVNLTKFAAGSAKELLGRNEATKQQAALEQSVLSILQKNSVFTEKILNGKMTTVQAEKQLLDYLTAQSNVMREQERLSKIIGANLGRAGVSIGASGVPLTGTTGKKTFSSGFIPNFASDRVIGQAMENAGAKEHGYKAGNARKTRIHDGNGKSFSSFVNSKEDVKTFTNAAGKKATVVRPPNGFGENTQYAANGYIPNFANSYKYSIGSFAGGKINNPNAKREFNSAINSTDSEKYKNIERDDKISSVGFKIEKIPISSILDQELNNQDDKVRSKAALDFEKEAIRYLSSRGKSFLPGSEYLYGGNRSSVDGFNLVPGQKLMNLLEVKSGKWNPLEVGNKFGRFIPENIKNSKDPYISKTIQSFFTEGVKDQQDVIKLNSTLAVPDNNIGNSFIRKKGKKEIDSYSSFSTKSIAARIKKKKAETEKGGKNRGGFASGFVPNFASMGSKFKAMYGGGTTMRAVDKEKTAKKKNLDVEKLDLSDEYTMVHGGNQGLDPTNVSLEVGNKLFDAKIQTAGLDLSGTNLQRYGIKGVVGDALVGATNNIIKTFGGKEQITDASSLDNAGSVGSAAGTVFETALRKAFNAPAVSQTQRIDFPAPTPELKKFFHNAPGQYEAKISRTPDNLKSTLKKWVAVKGLASSASGFVPNFANFSNQRIVRGIKGGSGGSVYDAAEQATSGATTFSKMSSAAEEDIVMTLLGSNFAFGGPSSLAIAGKSTAETHSKLFSGFTRPDMQLNRVVQGKLSGKAINVPYGNLGKMARNIFSRTGNLSDYERLLSKMADQSSAIAMDLYDGDDKEIPALTNKLRPILQANINKSGKLKGLTTNAPDYDGNSKYFSPFSLGSKPEDFIKDYSIEPAFSGNDVYDLSSIDPSDQYVSKFARSVGSLKVGTFKKWSDPEVQAKMKALRASGIPVELTRSVGKPKKFPSGSSFASSGFVPNFAKSGLSFSHKDKDEFGFSEIQAIMSGKRVGSFSYAEDKKGLVDVGDFSVNKSERGRGIGTELYKEAIRRNKGKKMKGQLLPQMNRLLQKIKNGEPVSAETLYPQIRRADLAKSSVFEVYGHKGMTVEKMTRDQFSSFVSAKINELKKDPKKLQSFFGNVEADEYGGLGVDLQTQHSAGFVPNFARGPKGNFDKLYKGYIFPDGEIFNGLDHADAWDDIPAGRKGAIKYVAPFGGKQVTLQGKLNKSIADTFGKFGVDPTNIRYGSVDDEMRASNEAAISNKLSSIANDFVDVGGGYKARFRKLGGEPLYTHFKSPDGSFYEIQGGIPPNDIKYYGGFENLASDRFVKKISSDKVLGLTEQLKGEKALLASGFVPNFLEVKKGGLPFGIRGRMNYGSTDSKRNIQLGIGAEQETLAHELFHGAYSKSTVSKAVSNPSIGKFISDPGKYAGSGMLVGSRIFKNLKKDELIKSLGLNPVQLDFDGRNPGATYSGAKAIDEIVTRIQEKVFKSKGDLNSLSADQKAFVKNLEEEGIISNKRLSNVSRRSQEGSKFRNLVEGRFSSAMGGAYSGYIPNFSNALNEAIAREQSSGLSKSQIYVDKHSSLKNKNNPMGLMVANRRDEPNGGVQGIRRAKKEGRDPKTYGAAGGYIPNFAAESSGDGSENTIAALIAGLQGLAFTALFLRGEMRSFGESIKQSEKSVKELSDQNDQSQKKVDGAVKRQTLATAKSKDPDEIEKLAKRTSGVRLADSQALAARSMENQAFKDKQAAEDALNNAKGKKQTKKAFGDLQAADTNYQSATANRVNAERDANTALVEATRRVSSSLNARVRSLQEVAVSEREQIAANNQAIENEKKSIKESRSQRLASIASQAGMAAQIIAPQIASFIPQDTQGGRGAAAAVEGVGNIAGMAGTGAMIGGPWGAAAGAAIGALLEIPKIEKAFTSKMPELEKAVTAATENFTKFSESGQQFLNSSQKLAEIRVNPSSSEGDIIAAEKQYIDALGAMPIKYQEQLVAAERLGNAQAVYSEILEQLALQKGEAEVKKNVKGVAEKSGAAEGQFFTKAVSAALGDSSSAGIKAVLGIDIGQGISDTTRDLAGVEIDPEKINYAFDLGAKALKGVYSEILSAADYLGIYDQKNALTTAKYGERVSSEDINSTVSQTYNYTKTADDPSTVINEALNNARAFGQGIQKIQESIKAEGGVTGSNFDSQKNALLDALRTSFTASGGEMTSGELQVLSNLKEAINRPDQLQRWLENYQSENNNFISSQEKIEEVRKNIAERQKKEAEKRTQEKKRSDEAGARVSAAKSSVDQLFSDFKYAMEEGLSKVKFGGQLEANRGDFAKEIYDLTNMPNASKNRDENNKIFNINQAKKDEIEQLKTTGASSLFESIGNMIDSASLDESAISAMTDAEKKSATSEFELKKTELKNELIGSGAMNQVMQGDTAGAKNTLDSLIEKMIASGNFTATQIQDLKNKAIQELDSVDRGIKTSNRNELQQKALLAQQLAFDRAKEKITQAQNLGGGAEEIIPNLLGAEDSLINQIKDSISKTVAGGYNVSNLIKGSDGRIVDERTGKAPSFDSLGSVTDTLSKLTKFAGVPITSMGDTNFQAVSQGYGQMLTQAIDDFEKQSGGALGPEVFKRLRDQVSSLGTDKEGGAGVAANLQLMQKLGVIDSSQYVDEVTGSYTKKEFENLPKELQDAYKGVTGDTKLQFLAINELTNVSSKGFGNVVEAVKGSFDVTKISEGIKQGLIAGQVSERRISAQEGKIDAESNLQESNVELENKRASLSDAKSKFQEAIKGADEAGFGALTFREDSFWNNPENIKGMSDMYSEKNVDSARTKLDQGVNVEENRDFLNKAEAFNRVKAARDAMGQAQTNVIGAESSVARNTGKVNAAKALVEDYSSQATGSDQATLDKMTQIRAQNQELAGKGFFTPGDNFMNPQLIPKPAPPAPTVSPIDQAMASFNPSTGGSSAQPNLSTNVGSINVPFSINIQQQAGAPQEAQQAQVQNANQLAEGLKNQIQELAQKVASMNAELQKNGSIKPPPPTNPNIK